MTTYHREYTILCPFGGLGAGALGFIRAETRLFETSARFRLLGGIDHDAEACADFEYLTGVPEWCADVWTITAADVRARFGTTAPDVCFASPPCTGASGLLSEKQARTAKYRKLNQLALRWVKLMLEAWPDAPPRLILLENVPRIVKRARRVLLAVKALLRRAGYVFHEATHDAGAIGGLAQHRRRYLLVARHQKSVPTLLYQPVPKRVRACGEVLGELPMPNDPAGGPMHRLPAIGWLNWVRLALIPAGGDWRDLPGVLAEGLCDCGHGTADHRSVGPAALAECDRCSCLGFSQTRKWFGGTLGVTDWNAPASTITGRGDAACGRFAVADPRVASPLIGIIPLEDARRTVPNPSLKCKPRAGAYGVGSWDEPAGTVIGNARVDNGTAAIADPRVRFSDHDRGEESGHGVIPQAGNPNMHQGKYEVRGWDEPTGTVTGASRPGSGGQSVADPRAPAFFGNVLRVVPWGEPAGTITSSPSPSSGAVAVADPRVKTAYPHGYGVLGWQQPSFTVAGGTMPGQGAYSVADPRLDRWAIVGLIPVDEVRGTVTGTIATPFAIVDPSRDGPPLMVVRDIAKAPPAAPVILAADGTWHRPLTTLELAVLQGLPATVNGKPLALTGERTGMHRQRIGNAVPVQAATAIGEQMLLTLLSADLGAFALSSGGQVWVSPKVESTATNA